MSIFIQSFILILGFEFILFLFALRFKRNDLADVGWGLGFGICAVFCFYLNPQMQIFQKILLSLAVLWSLRLSIYLGWRMSGKSEDQRYVEMRSSWATNQNLKSFLYVFVLQGIILWILSIPLVYHLSAVSLNMGSMPWVPLAVSLFGLIYETIADLQKSAFKKKDSSPDSFIQSGLFKYSRYPQYFGEILFWSGVALFQLSFGAHLALIYAPVLLALLLIYFSGVPLLEVKYLKRPGYKDYAAKTPLLVPGLKLFRN